MVRRARVSQWLGCEAPLRAEGDPRQDDALLPRQPQHNACPVTRLSERPHEKGRLQSKNEEDPYQLRKVLGEGNSPKALDVEDCALALSSEITLCVGMRSDKS